MLISRNDPWEPLILCTTTRAINLTYLKLAVHIFYKSSACKLAVLNNGALRWFSAERLRARCESAPSALEKVGFRPEDVGTWLGHDRTARLASDQSASTNRADRGMELVFGLSARGGGPTGRCNPMTWFSRPSNFCT
jgi:hypothetical protein